jgi:hypothetical protein
MIPENSGLLCLYLPCQLFYLFLFFGYLQIKEMKVETNQITKLSPIKYIEYSHFAFETNIKSIITSTKGYILLF